MADPKALLAAANSASEKVATLHVFFLAICAYILVIVFGTTDLDLLIGKGVKLPVVDVEVPIVGFYALAPYLLALVHFYLLLSLQLLSQKLYAFDDAAQKNGESGGLHDQLNIFPYNHYLIGRPTRLVHGFLALVVTITMLLLPLAALLALQARFLAYQSEAVTWAQRLVVWLDVVLVAIFWPVIMDRRDSWSAYMGAVWRHARLHWVRWLWGIAGLLVVVFLLVREVEPRTSTQQPTLVPESKEYLMWLTEPWLFKLLVGWLLLTLLVRPLRRCARWLSHGRYFALQDGGADFILGAPGLLAILLLGLPLPLLLVTDGEKLDRPAALSTRILASLRHLNLHERVLLAKPLQPETLADLRGSHHGPQGEFHVIDRDPARTEAALRSVQRIDLQNRSLRRADFSNALLPKADLRGAQLQGAYVFGADLRGADLRGAQLQDTVFVGTMLNGANLEEVQLKHTIFAEVSLERANLRGAKMQGMILSEEVWLQGANLSGAQLQGAELSSGAGLQGTNLSGAQLQGTELSGAQLRGANLQGAVLYTDAKLHEPVDARGLKWRPLNAEQIQWLREIQAQLTWSSKEDQSRYNAAIEKAAAPGLKPPQLGSCLRDNETQVTCDDDLSLAQFRALLLDELERLACESLDTTRGFIRRLELSINRSHMKGVALRLQNRVKAADSNSCPGLAELPAKGKVRLSALASKDEEPDGPAKGAGTE
ncbi:MAG: pentapeptide repeat-containing protein [Candidatus Manganitrophaceae bacterium]